MSDNAPISKKLGYGVIAVQVIICLLLVDDKAMTLGIGAIMASLFFAHDKSNTVKFGIWGVIGLFVVYHFSYGLYAYSRTPAKTVCGTFKEYYKKKVFKRQDLMLSMYATDEQKFMTLCTFIAITNIPTFLKIVMIKMSRFAWIISPCQHLPFFRPMY